MQSIAYFRRICSKVAIETKLTKITRFERASLRGAKEKTLAKPRFFSERKLKMVDIRGETSNLLFTTLEQWNEILQDTSVVKWGNENYNFANVDIPPKIAKKLAKPKSNKASA